MQNKQMNASCEGYSGKHNFPRNRYMDMYELLCLYHSFILQQVHYVSRDISSPFSFRGLGQIYTLLQVNNQGVSAKLKYWNSTCSICFLVAWHSKAVALRSWSYQRYSQDFSIFLLLFLQPVVQLSLCQKTPSSNPPPLLIVSFKFMQLNPLAHLVQHGCSREAGENERRMVVDIW